MILIAIVFTLGVYIFHFAYEGFNQGWEGVGPYGPPFPTFLCVAGSRKQTEPIRSLSFPKICFEKISLKKKRFRILCISFKQIFHSFCILEIVDFMEKRGLKV